jgi:hypothetical protein
MCRLSWNMKTSASWKTQGLSRPVMWMLYLFIIGIFHWLNPSGRKFVPGIYLWGSKGGRCVGLTALSLPCADCLEILRSSTSWNPQDLSRTVMDSLPLPNTHTFLTSIQNYRPFSMFFLAYTRSWGCFSLHFKMRITSNLTSLLLNYRIHFVFFFFETFSDLFHWTCFNLWIPIQSFPFMFCINIKGDIHVCIQGS